MTDTTTLGLVFPPVLPPEAVTDAAVAAEEAGLDHFWVSEDCFAGSGVAQAVAALAATRRIRVGIALLPVPLRSVAQAAMEIASIDRMFPGRFTATVGHGIQPWMAQAGVQAGKPLTLLREYTTALRSLLAGETVSTSGEYVQLDDVALAHPPSSPPPLLVGAAGPRSLAVAGQLGTGTALALGLSVGDTGKAVEATLATAGPGHEVLGSVIAATGPEARARVDAELSAYFMAGGPDVGAAGTAGEIASRVGELAAAGVTGVSVQSCRDEPDLAAFAHFLGAEVKPLL